MMPMPNSFESDFTCDPDMGTFRFFDWIGRRVFDSSTGFPYVVEWLLSDGWLDTPKLYMEPEYGWANVIADSLDRASRRVNGDDIAMVMIMQVMLADMYLSGQVTQHDIRNGRCGATGGRGMVAYYHVRRPTLYLPRRLRRSDTITACLLYLLHRYDVYIRASVPAMSSLHRDRYEMGSMCRELAILMHNV